MIVKHRINMDLDRGNEEKCIDVMQDDKYSRDLEIRLKSNLQDFCPPEGCTVLVRYSKPDRQYGTYDTMPNGEKAWQIEGNLVTVKLAPQVCTAAGKVMLVVALLYADAELSCFHICVNVHERPNGVSASEKYININGFIPQPKTAAVGQYLKVTATNKRGQVTAVTTASEVAVDGKDGKSAYEFAQEGGYTGTEEEFSQKLAEKPLIGTTAEITPNQVRSAMLEGRAIGITHADSMYGAMAFNSFAMSAAAGNSIVSSVNFEIGNTAFCAQLIGSLTYNVWTFTATQLAKRSDIPETLPNPQAVTFTDGFFYNEIYDGSAPVTVKIPIVPSTLPNPNALTINGSIYDGSAAADLTEAVNALIDAKIGTITNAEEVAF